MLKFLLITMALVAAGSGFCIYINEGVEWYKAFYYTLQLFVVNIGVPDEIGKNTQLSNYIYFPATIAALTTFLTVIAISLKFFTLHIRQGLMRLCGDHTIVVGLGSNNRYYIDSELDSGNKNIIVIEKDINNSHINRYTNQGIVVLNNYIDNVIDKIGIHKVKNILISTGNDTENINIALKILEYDQKIKGRKSDNPRLSIHIEDKMLRNIYHGETLLKSKRFYIVPFSYFEDSAVALFESHSIDGEGRDIIDSNKEFSIVVVGNSQLAVEVIEQACKVAHLPNENILTIHSITNDTNMFKEKIEHAFPYISKIPNIQIEYHTKNIDSIEFYHDNIFKESQNLTHIILCDINQDKNISQAIKLTDSTYRKEIVEDRLTTKIHVALFTNSVLAKKVNLLDKVGNKDSCNSDEVNYFKNIHIFAIAREICHRDNLSGHKKFKVGQVIRYGYGNIYKKELCQIFDKKLIDKWQYETPAHDKDSNLAQAKHINIKLKALGLKSQKASYFKSYHDLYLENKKQLFEKVKKDREKIGLDDEALEKYTKELSKFYAKQPYEVYYFPKDYNTLFEKLIRSEHNRWNAYHYLLGFEYANKKCKANKEHDCLIPYNKFEKKDIKITVFYDIYSILYIPSYLAHVGYELRELDDA